MVESRLKGELMKRRSGIALFVTMMSVVVMAMLVGAFFSAYRSHFSLTRSSNASQAAASACESVYEYVVFRLEHDRTWGSQEFDRSGEGDPMGDILEFLETPGTHQFKGEIESLGASFEGFLYNNLSGAAGPEVALRADPGTAFCSVVSRSGDSTRQAQFVVRVAPLFDSSVLTRADLKVDATHLAIRSQDRNRNMIRSEGDIYIPDVLLGAQSEFLLPMSTEADPNGMLWAKGDIHSFEGSSTSWETIDDAEKLETASRNIKGKIVSRADSHFSIFDLDQENLKIPDSHTQVDVPSGRWNFVRRPAYVTVSATYNFRSRYRSDDSDLTASGVAWVDVLEYFADPDDEAPTRVFRGAHRTADIAAQMDGSFTTDWGDTYHLDENSITTNSVTVPGYPSVEMVQGDVLGFGPETGPTFRFDLGNQRVEADHNVLVTVDGPFHLTSQTFVDSEHGNDVRETPPPTLDLGYAEDSSIEGGVSKAAIVAEGTINIENGITEGLGSLISRRGNVEIQPKSTDRVDIDLSHEGSGYMIFAGGNVILRNPDDTRDWNLKGLIYARQGIKMEGSNRENAVFEGSLVALQEHPPTRPGDPNGIEFENCDRIQFIYNSDLLKAYVHHLPGDRTQVETVYWRR